MSITISLTMIVRNESKCLARCLNSAKPFVQEIVIIDTGSTDDTKTIAKQYTDHVYDFTWINDFSAARNEALRLSTGNWNLVLDADEMITNFPITLLQLMQEQNFLGTIEITSPYIAKGEMKTSKTNIVRLFPRGYFFKGSIHEQVNSALPVRSAGICVFHNGYEVSKADRNVPLLLSSLKKDPNSAYLHYQVAREYYGMERFDEAIVHFKLAYLFMTGSEPFYPGAVVAYLYALRDINLLDDALAIISAHELSLAGFPDFHFFCGLFYTDYILSHLETHADKLYLIESSYLECLSIGENHPYNSVVGTGSFLAAHNLSIFYELLGDAYRAKHYRDLESTFKQ